ncbi:MAG: TRAP transporter substrate-binding protein [Lachnospirales bacterium]
MKRFLSILTVSTLAVATLTSCGGSSETTTETESETATETETTDSSSESETSEVDPLEIKISVTYQQTETGGDVIQHFVDTLSETSNGQITAKVSWGGTLFSSNEELDAVMDGSVDMVALGHMPHTNTLNYLSFPSFAPGGTQAALDYFQTLMFDDPETSALIQGEAADMGIKYLNVIAGGANAYCAKYEFSDLDSLIDGSAAFGNMDGTIFEHLGFMVTSIAPPDVYDALNRGLVDSTQMALAPMVAMSWYEPAPYWALDGTYAAGNFFTVNLDWWEALSPEQQTFIEEAALETQDYSASVFDEEIGSQIALVEEKTGNTFVELSQEDIDTFWAAVFEAKSEAALAITDKSGKSEGMEVILDKAAEITNYTRQ